MNFREFLLNEDRISLLNLDSYGNISFLIGNTRYDYFGGDGGMLAYWREKYRYRPGKFLNLVKKLNLPFKKTTIQL